MFKVDVFMRILYFVKKVIKFDFVMSTMRLSGSISFDNNRMVIFCLILRFIFEHIVVNFYLKIDFPIFVIFHLIPQT
jgi:hypothetical protein